MTALYCFGTIIQLNLIQILESSADLDVLAKWIYHIKTIMMQTPLRLISDKKQNVQYSAQSSNKATFFLL